MANEQMGSGRQGQPNDLEQQILGSRQLYDLLVAKISDVAVERMETQHNRARNRTAIFLTIFVAALSGIATFGFNALQESIKDQAVTEAKRTAAEAAREAEEAGRAAAIAAVGRAVPVEVENAVRAQVGAAREAWTHLSQQTRLVTELTTLRRLFQEKGGFTQEEANRVLDLLTQVNDEDGQEIPEFETLLEQIIDVFQAADRDDLVSRLEPYYKNIMLDQIGIVYTMVESLGRTLISFPVTPGELGESRMRSEWDSLMTRYQEYATAARRHRYPELPYPYDLILSRMEGDPRAVVNTRLHRLTDLSQQEKETITKAFISLGTGSWRINGIDETAALAMERTMSLLQDLSDGDETYTLQQALAEIKFQERQSDSGAIDLIAK